MHKVTGVKKIPTNNILAPEVPPEIKLKSKLSGGFGAGVGLERKILNRKRHDNNELNIITNAGSYPSQNM